VRHNIRIFRYPNKWNISNQLSEKSSETRIDVVITARENMKAKAMSALIEKFYQKDTLLKR